MQNLLLLLRDIIQLRRGPQDVPYSLGLLIGACVVTLTMQIVIGALFDSASGALATGVVSLILHLGILYLLLMMRGFGNRFVQSATAILWCMLMFTLALLPMISITGTAQVTADQITVGGALLRLVMIAIALWKVAVDAHILRHSLSISFGGGVGVAIVWALVEYALLRAISPQTPGL